MMMSRPCMKSLLFLLCTLCLCSSHSSTLPLRFSAFLDRTHQIYLRWDHKDDMITFDLQVQSTGWVAFGFTHHGEMAGADIVIGGVLPDGNMYFSDWHGVDDKTILEDESQDYELLGMTEDKTSTTMTFRRYLRTCDENDLPITSDTLRLVTGFGSDDTIDFFKGNITHKSLFLLLVYREEDMHGPSVYHVYDLKLDDFIIPDDDTTYACTFIPLPIVKKKHHIYKFEPVITPRNETMVHHILVYACGNASVLPSGVSDCYGADPDFALCSQIVVGWAVGGGSYMFPDETGISIGTPLDAQWIRLEVHFSNFNLIPENNQNEGVTMYHPGMNGKPNEWLSHTVLKLHEDLVDNSGIRLYYTPELRPYDMGVLQTGFFTFPIHFLPPGADSFNSYGLCNTSQFDEMNGTPVPDMHVFGFLLHTHLCGTGIRGVQYRDGKQLRVLCEDLKYDFNLQETRALPEVVVFKPGDEFLVECRYQTRDRTGLTFGGPSTLNEMCLAFLFYYPRNNISSCMGYPNIQYVAQQLGQEASDAMEGMMAINMVEWNNDSIKRAEQACKEAEQIVIIKTIDELVRNETGFIRDIVDPEPPQCKNMFWATPESRRKRQAENQAMTMVSSKALSTEDIWPRPALLFIPLGFTWLLTSSQFEF